MRRTSEYHMECPCGAAIVTRELGPVKCEKCGREATVCFSVLTVEAKKCHRNRDRGALLRDRGEPIAPGRALRK
jgi:hypothetical protein